MILYYVRCMQQLFCRCLTQKKTNWSHGSHGRVRERIGRNRINEKDRLIYNAVLQASCGRSASSTTHMFMNCRYLLSISILWPRFLRILNQAFQSYWARPIFGMYDLHPGPPMTWTATRPSPITSRPAKPSYQEYLASSRLRSTKSYSHYFVKRND